MASYDAASDPTWPPGTVKLAQLLGRESKDAEIVLQPRPTNNPNDPLNWKRWQKMINYILACFYAMMVTTFINATSPTWGPLAAELNFSDATLTNTYAIGCATLAVGPPMLIPFALKLGLRPVYIVSSVGQLAVSIWAARTMTAGDWWGVNSVQCWLGALSNVLIQMTIADIYFVHQRGLKNAIYVWAEQVGSYLAVVAAGFITTSQGWRWVWWWCTIIFGAQCVAFFFAFEESKFIHVETLEGQQGSVKTVADISGHIHGDYKDTKEHSPVALSQDSEQGVEESHTFSTVQLDHSIPRKTYLQKLSLTTISPGSWSDFFRHSWQPFVILVRIPGVLFCACVYAIVLAYSTVQTTALSTIMLDPPYSFSANQIGLMSLAPFIGSTIGLLICGPISDWVVIQLAKRNNGIYEPEMRFWVFVPFVPFQIAGAWWFGYSLNNGASWEQVAVAYGMCLFGSAPLQSLALTYILDAYNEIVGDALTALNFCRYLLSTIFVFALNPWIAGMGVGNVFNIMGAIALTVLSFAGLFIWRGKRLRASTAQTYRYFAARQYERRPL